MKEHLKHKKDINLISHNKILKSEPFEDFYGDCETCFNYQSSGNMCEGGKCLIHNCSCGYGFTCDNWEIRERR